MDAGHDRSCFALSTIRRRSLTKLGSWQKIRFVPKPSRFSAAVIILELKYPYWLQRYHAPLAGGQEPSLDSCILFDALFLLRPHSWIWIGCLCLYSYLVWATFVPPLCIMNRIRVLERVERWILFATLYDSLSKMGMALARQEPQQLQRAGIATHARSVRNCINAEAVEDFEQEDPGNAKSKASEIGRKKTTAIFKDDGGELRKSNDLNNV